MRDRLFRPLFYLSNRLRALFRLTLLELLNILIPDPYSVGMAQIHSEEDTCYQEENDYGISFHNKVTNENHRSEERRVGKECRSSVVEDEVKIEVQEIVGV